jgi:NAD(P)-dependent dehydrogenase (short-subunit alcohol dehydrogenase family)
MPGRLQDRTAIVTGGVGGIGLATSRRFAEEGAKVVVVDLDDEQGAAVAAAVSNSASTCS